VVSVGWVFGFVFGGTRLDQPSEPVGMYSFLFFFFFFGNPRVFSATVGGSPALVSSCLFLSWFLPASPIGSRSRKETGPPPPIDLIERTFTSSSFFLFTPFRERKGLCSFLTFFPPQLRQLLRVEVINVP